MYEKAKHYTISRPRLKRAVGVFCVIVGFVALIAPVIPGAPLVFIGLELLGFRFLFLERMQSRFAKRREFPIETT